MRKFVFVGLALLLLLRPAAASSEISELRRKMLGSIQGVDGLTYQAGSKGAGVREFQRALISSGYASVGQDDGVYGSKTASAVREFQAANDLPVTGSADIYTQLSLVIMHSKFFMPKGNAYIIQLNNYAVIIWPDKAFYVGAVDKSANLVEGTYYYKEGCYYAGSYRNNLRFGKGTARFTNGDVYIGQWKNDAMHGQGTYYYGGANSTEYYAGNMANNNLHGYGVFHSKGSVISGQWSNNQHVR